MRFLKKLLFGNVKSGQMVNYIFYHIIEFSRDNEEYVIRCINTKAIIKQKIGDIVLDVDILHGLHPVQACYIGLESGKRIQEICSKNSNQKIMCSNFLKSRYGKYEISGQVRSGDVCFLDKSTSEQLIIDPRDICLNNDLLIEFDASHAFYIGLYASIKRDSGSTVSMVNALNKAHLKVVK